MLACVRTVWAVEVVLPLLSTPCTGIGILNSTYGFIIVGMNHLD